MGAISSIFGYLLNWLYEILNNYGFAIILFSIILRVLLIPITIKQQKSMKKSAEMQEKLKVLQNKYKNDPEKLNKATMELYKKENTSPFAGCLGSILQIIIILSVFWLVSRPLTYMRKVYNYEDTKAIMEQYTADINNTAEKKAYPEIQIIERIEEDYKKINEELEKDENEQIEQETIEENGEEEQLEKLTKEELESKKETLNKMRINMEFLGLNLSKIPGQNYKDVKVLIIPILYVISTFLSMKINTAMQNKAKNKKEEKKEENIEEKEEKNEQEETLESMQEMTKSMSYMMPIMSISIAAIAPLGLALYWLISNVLMIAERVIIDTVCQKEETKKLDAGE